MKNWMILYTKRGSEHWEVMNPPFNSRERTLQYLKKSGPWSGYEYRVVEVRVTDVFHVNLSLNKVGIETS